MKTFEQYNDELEFINNMKYGLIVVDKNENKRFDGDNILFHHFCGYAEKPKQSDIDSLRLELKTDEDFKMDNIDDMDIIEAPDYVVTYFKNDMLENIKYD
jgi:hypothetical protein